jgi:heat shock protein HslJ
MPRGLAFVFAFVIVTTAFAQSEFPYDRDMVLDARPMRGSKRVPVLAIGADGSAQIDLWCKRGQGQATISGDAITLALGTMNDEPCTPERTQADEDMIAALSAVTSWSMRGDVVTLSGGATLRFRLASH